MATRIEHVPDGGLSVSYIATAKATNNGNGRWVRATRHQGLRSPHALCAVRIPAAVARSAHFRVGQPVEVSAQDSNVLVRPLGEPKLTLAQKLTAFDPAVHSGEVIATVPVGNEAR
jgi:antitoxin MazE